MPQSVLATVLQCVLLPRGWCVCCPVVAESVLAAVCVAASCMLHAKTAAPAAGEPRSGAKYVAVRPERRGGKKGHATAQKMNSGR